MRLPVARLAASLLLLLLLGACDKAPPTAPAEQPPVADSPANALRVLEWGFDHRRVDLIAGVLAEDVSFVSAGVDSAGNPVRDSTALSSRAALLDAIRALLEGSPNGPPAARVELDLDRTPLSFPDPRPGRDPLLHRVVRTALHLRVDVGDGSVYEISGSLTLYLVRGDAAAVPADLRNPLNTSSARWWFSRLEDETYPSGGFAAHPARSIAFADVLLRYLQMARAR